MKKFLLLFTFLSFVFLAKNVDLRALTSVAEVYETDIESTTEYVPRLTAPETTDIHYYGTPNPFVAAGYGMPNCTCYAWGRAYELLGTQPYTLSCSDAEYWYCKDDNYERGQVPKLGAIACWDGGDGLGGNPGHVAVVEAINGDTVTVSESGWQLFVFRVRDIKNITETKGFQGFIYIDEFTPLTYNEDDFSDAYAGNYKTMYDLSFRSGPSTEYQRIYVIPKGTEVYVNKSDGEWAKITWHEVEGWVYFPYLEKIIPPDVIKELGAGRYKVVTDVLNVRDDPSTAGKILGTLKEGDIVDSNGVVEDSRWLNIDYNTGEGIYAYANAGEKSADLKGVYLQLIATPEVAKAADILKAAAKKRANDAS